MCLSFTSFACAVVAPLLGLQGEAHAFTIVSVWLGTVATCIGALLLNRPHDGTTPRQRFASLLSAIGFASTGAFLSWVDPLANRISVSDFAELTGQMLPLFTFLAIAHCLHAISILMLRPAVRDLAARSVLMRSGSVNRQTLAATSAVLAIAALGELFVAFTISNVKYNALGIIGLAFAFSGTILLIVGGVGLVFDAFRLMPILLEPPKRLSSLIRRGPSRD